MRKVAVIGVGMHAYGKWNEKSWFDLARPAIEGALQSSGLKWEDIRSGWCGHTNGGMTCGARLFGQMGHTGLSITNVENASATGSYAFRGAYLEVGSGEFDIALALGIDKRSRGATRAADGESPTGFPPGISRPESRPGPEGKKGPGGGSALFLPVMKFAQDARDHMEKYGSTIDQMAQISVKQHRNAARNPHAQYQKEVTLEEVHKSRMVADPLTVLHCCPRGDGAAAAILASEEAVKRLGISKPVWVRTSVSKSENDPEEGGWDLSKLTAREAYKRSGIGPGDLGMVELHDAFTIEEIIQAENLGLCAPGRGGDLVDEGATEITGRIPINTSGGLLAMGHPLGPTGLGQIAEIFWQLRGEAGARQIPSLPKSGLAHMIGLGGTCIIHIFST